MTSRHFEEAVTRVVASLPPGTVIAYSEVAAEAGFPGAARAVGNLLRRTDAQLPWWRVVTVDGRLVPGAEDRQRALLAAEGIAVRRGHVVPAQRPSGRRR